MLGHVQGEAAIAAHQIAAFAARHLHALAESTAHFEKAAALAEQAGDQPATGRLLRSLAGNHAMGGRFGDALATLERAAAHATGYDAVIVDAQRATIFLASDRHNEAVALFRKIAPAVEAEGDRAALARVHGNLGSALMQLARFDEAREAMERARSLCAAERQHVLQAEVVHNLGLCAAMAGRVPDALQLFHEAGALGEQTGVVDGIGLADQARALLAARLAEDAEATARRALDLLDAGGVHTWAAEAFLVLAQARLAQGAASEAAALAAKAGRRFADQGRAPGQALAAALELMASSHLGTDEGVARSLSIAADLRHHGYPIEAADLLVSAARAALHAGNPAAAHMAAAQVEPAAGTRPAGLRVREAYAAAVVRRVDGDTPGALAELEAGMAALEQHRLALGATELRVRASEMGVDLAELGLAIVQETGSPRDVFAWADRLRANSLEYPPGQPPADDALRIALANVRAASRQRGQADALAAAERRVLEALRRAPGAGTSRVATAEPTPGTIAFFEQGGELHRIDVDAGGARPPAGVARVDEVRGLLAHLVAAWRRWLRHRSTATGEAVTQALVASLAELDGVLGVRDLHPGPMVIVPGGATQGVPWSAMPSLQDRVVRVTPSAAIAARPPRPPGAAAVFVAGPGLAWAAAEAEELAALWPDGAAWTGDAATCDAALTAIEGADVVHFATHGRLRLDNPMFSALLLADGPLTVCDVEQLRDPPRVVVLSACDAGLAKVHPGDEVMGLVAALLQAGADTVIAPVLPVEDEASVPVMKRLHELLAAGDPPAAALAAAIRAFPAGAPEGMLARSLVCFGAG